MKFPFLASLIIFILVLGHAVRRQRKNSASADSSFWEREERANSVRRKSLEHLDYITVPLADLPIAVMAQDPVVAECIAQITELSKERIVNLTGYTNTDLKLEYGTANITELSLYDQNYTLLVCTLQKWADKLLEAGYAIDASVIMEFAVSTHTDISRTYYKLAEFWCSQGKISQIEHLIQIAEELHSANKNAIVRTLKQQYFPEG